MRLSTARTLTVGDRVKHPDYGKGTVTYRGPNRMDVTWAKTKHQTGFYLEESHQHYLDPLKKMAKPVPMSEEAKAALKAHNAVTKKPTVKSITEADILVALDRVREEKGWLDKIPLPSKEAYLNQRGKGGKRRSRWLSGVLVYLVRVTPYWVPALETGKVPCVKQQALIYNGQETERKEVRLYPKDLVLTLLRFLGIEKAKVWKDASELKRLID